MHPLVALQGKDGRIDRPGGAQIGDIQAQGQFVVIEHLDPPRHLQSGILRKASAEKNLVVRVILQEESFQTSFEIRFVAMERFKQAERRRKSLDALRKGAAAADKPANGKHYQSRIDGGAKQAKETETEQNFRDGQEDWQFDGSEDCY